MFFSRNKQHRNMVSTVYLSAFDPQHGRAPNHIDSMFYKMHFSRFVAYCGKRKIKYIMASTVSQFMQYKECQWGVIFFEGLWNNAPCGNFAMNSTATRWHRYEPLAWLRQRGSVWKNDRRYKLRDWGCATLICKCERCLRCYSCKTRQHWIP